MSARATFCVKKRQLSLCQDFVVRAKEPVCIHVQMIITPGVWVSLCVTQDRIEGDISKIMYILPIQKLILN